MSDDKVLDADPRLRVLLNEAADEWGARGVLLVALAMWPDSLTPIKADDAQREVDLRSLLVAEQHRRCAYGTTHGDGQRCDCKYPHPLLNGGSEATDCPEMRDAIQALDPIRGVRMSACVCGADEPCTYQCDKHGQVLHGYPCGQCEREWRDAHPKTAAAIARFAAGKGSVAAINAARRSEGSA